MENSDHRLPYRNNRRATWDRRIAVWAVITIIAAWIIGRIAFPTESPTCDLDVLPGATQCRTLEGHIFEGTKAENDDTETVIGWATFADAPGYAGDVQVMVGVSPAGELLGVKVIAQSETPSFYRLIEQSHLLTDFAGVEVTSPFQLDTDVDSVTNATVTTKAIASAVRTASYTLGERQLGLEVTRAPEPIEIGALEIVVIGLFAAGYIGHQREFRFKKQVRWVAMLTGLVVLGFIYNTSLTVSHFNSLFIGSLPDWRTNLYWFLLVGGTVFVITADGKNPYCSWFCPFGAAQECLGAIGRAKYIQPRRGKPALRWVQRGLAWSAIVLALLLRNPGFSSYEIFGTLFAFSGTNIQWVILVAVVLLSLFTRRPWCHFLCPIDPITDFIAAIRRWIRELWQKKQSQGGVRSPMRSSLP